MKAFIVAALLVAAVAGQSMDILKLNKEKSMLKFDRPLVNELLLKKLGYPMDKTLIYGDNIDIPLYLQDELLDKKVLLLDEIMVQPLFREYMSLPLFRQYWSYPVFQKYVASVYFQRFFHIPAFKQYFVNPILFQKYVYPFVTLFKTNRITTDITSTSFLDEILKGDLFKGDMINKNAFPVVSGYETELLKEKLFTPNIYNNDFKFYDDVYPKNLLEKLYNHLLINKPIIDDEFLGKIVDPITGEIKTVDDEIIPVEYIKTIYGEKLVKNILLKKLIKINVITPEIYEAILLGKIDLVSVLLKEKIISNEVYQLILLGKVDKFTLFRHILRQDTLKTVVVEDLVKEVLLKKLLKFNIITPEVYEAILVGKIDLVTVLLKENIITPEIYQLVVLGKVDLFTVLRQVLGQETFQTTFVPEHLVKEVLLKKLVQYNIITPEIYQAILYGKIDLVTVLLKENIITPEIYQLILLGKVEKVTVFRHILRQDTLKTVVVEDLVKEVLLKKLLKFNIITPQVYEAILLKKIDLFTILLKERIISPEVYQYVLLGKVDKFTVFRHILNQETLKTVVVEDLFQDKFAVPSMYKMNPLVSRMLYNTQQFPLVNKFDTFDTVDKMNLFDIKKDLVHDDFLPMYMKKDFVNDKIAFNKVFADKVNDIETLGKFDTVTPKMVDIHTPTMGVKTFDKKMIHDIKA